MSWAWVKFQRPVIYSSTETWVQGWKVLWQLAVSLCYRTKEMFSVIDKACHSQTLNFKARQQGYVGLAFERSELIRKTFLCCQSLRSLSPWAILGVGVCMYLVKCWGLLVSYLRPTELQSSFCHWFSLFFIAMYYIGQWSRYLSATPFDLIV